MQSGINNVLEIRVWD